MSVIVAYAVNIFQLSVKCRRTIFVCLGVGNYRYAVNIFQLSLNTNEMFSFVETLMILAFPVNIFQFSVKHRRRRSICKSVGGVLKTKIFKNYLE